MTCMNWSIEAAYRMIQNNRDPDVADRPQDLVVYGGIGRAARDWKCFDAILTALKKLEPDETLLIQSGKPVGVFRTHEDAPHRLSGLAGAHLLGGAGNQRNGALGRIESADRDWSRLRPYGQGAQRQPLRRVAGVAGDLHRDQFDDQHGDE